MNRNTAAQPPAAAPNAVTAPPPMSRQAMTEPPQRSDAAGIPALTETRARLLPLRSLLADLEADTIARHEARQSGRARGAVTGFAPLDAAVGGHLATGLHILHGAPGTGKTAFALQIAGACGCACLYVTCEMAPLELLRRHMARVTQTYLGKFKSGELPPAVVMEHARRAIRAAPDLAFLDATVAPVTLDEIAQSAHIVRAAAAADSAAVATSAAAPPVHLLVVVDSLHAWAGAGDGPMTSEYDALNAGVAGLRALAARMEVPLLAIAERNRAGMRAGGQSAGAGTRKIEYGAETVFELDGDGDEDTATGERLLKLVISKNRHGGASGAPTRLRFNGGFQSFRLEATA